MVRAFDAARIRGDAENGQARPLQAYLDELLSPREQRDKRAAAFIRKFDALCAHSAAGLPGLARAAGEPAANEDEEGEA